jgi:uncharacterized protein (TIGR02246 family)
MDVEAVLEELQARERIRMVVQQYADGVDRHDVAQVEACFTDDAVFVYYGEEVRGVETIARLVCLGATGRFRAGKHVMGMPAVTLTPDFAAVETYAVVYLAEEPADGARVLLRGIAYHDTFVGNGADWRIARRVHDPQWMTEGVSSPPLRMTDAAPGRN